MMRGRLTLYRGWKKTDLTPNIGLGMVKTFLGLVIPCISAENPHIANVLAIPIAAPTNLLAHTRLRSSEDSFGQASI